MAGIFDPAIFQNELSGGIALFQVDSGAVEPEPEPTPGPTGGSRMVGGTFSRKRWIELKEAWEAQERLEAQAIEAENKRKSSALQKAAKMAALALASANAHEELQVTALVSAIDAATRARALATKIEEANRVVQIARVMVEEAEDEDFALSLILGMH